MLTAISAFHSIADTIASPGCSVVSTYIGLGVIALGTHVNGQYCVHILRLDDLALTVVKSFEVEESITAMSITTLFGIDCIVVSLWSAGLPSLVLFRINDDLEQISGVITTIPLGTYLHISNYPVSILTSSSFNPYGV